MQEELYDFAGWATRNDLKCADGRTIRKDAFKDCDGMTVPLVWNHMHSGASNVLGHGLLKNEPTGVRIYGSFNDTEDGRRGKEMVKHGDITSLSIYANQLKESAGNVYHGMIREVSLVLAGANPGAKIDTIICHNIDGDEEAIITTGVNLGDEVNEEPEEDAELDEHIDEANEFENEFEDENVEESNAEEEEEVSESEEQTEESSDSDEAADASVPGPVVCHADGEGNWIEDAINSMSDEQKKAMYTIVDAVLNDTEENSKSEGENEMKHNAFDAETENQQQNDTLSHSEMTAIIADGARYGSLRESCIQHGIEQIEYLFPEAHNVDRTPGFIKRDDTWVSIVMNGVHHVPFTRLKSMYANITEDDARAKGYIKGHMKKEEFFGLIRRYTSPTTVYKKQKLDRDDVIDITDFDVVAWLKTEMRGMLDEELARAYLVGDGRLAGSEDKIDEACIRPIWTDNDLYTIHKGIVLPEGASEDAKAKAVIRAAIKARKDYKGSGNCTFFTTEDMLTDMLLLEDGLGHRLYKTEAELATAMRCTRIVTVPVFEGLSRTVNGQTFDLIGIIINLNDYTVGADKGGAVNMFDDFDIDYNQMKYLIETRCSGSLMKPYSAIVLETIENAFIDVEPDSPTTTRYGKLVSELQDGIIVNDQFIEGKLNYVTGYTGYSGDPELQSGYFLSLNFDAPAGATTTVQLLGGHSGPVELEADMNCVFRIENPKTQKLKVVTTIDGAEVSKIFRLASLKQVKE